jgi:hypothetical protein
MISYFKVHSYRGKIKPPHCAIIFLSEKGGVRQNKNLAQIKLGLPSIKGDHMGLEHERQEKSLWRDCPAIPADGQKGPGKLLDEYTVTPGYNRDYLAHILSNWGKTLYAGVDGTPVKIIAIPAVKRGGKAVKTASTGRK